VLLNRLAVRGSAAVAAAVLLVGGVAGSASAAVPAVARISLSEVSANSTGSISIEVTNPAATGGLTASKNPAINSVRIFPPLTSSGAPTATLDTAGATTGFSAARTTDGSGFRFTATGPAATGSSPLKSSTPGIADAGKAIFKLGVSYLPQAADAVGQWRVQTSTDGGSSYTDAAANGASELTQTVHTLSILTYPLTLSGGLRAGKVTQGQTGITVSYVLKNVGTQAATVTLGASNVVGDAAPSTTAVIGPGETFGYSAPVSFPRNGTRARAMASQVSGSSAAGAVGSKTIWTNEYVVQAPAAFSCTNLTPTLAHGGELIRPKVDIAQATVSNGVEGATLQPAGTSLGYGTGIVGGSTPLVSSQPTTAGATQTAVAFADARTSGGSADRSYPVSLTVGGIDLNGAAVAQSAVGCSGVSNLTVDVTSPVAAVTVTTPQHRPTAVGEAPGATTGDYVAKNKDALTVGGTISDGGSPAAADTTSVPTCTLHEYGSVGPITPQDIPCTNKAGVLSATAAPQYNPTATSAQLEVTVRDTAGNVSAPALSAAWTVDTQPPAFDELASTTTTPSTIVLKTDELVAFGYQAADWTVTEGGTRHLVASVTGNGGAGKFGDSITLTLRDTLPEDATPTVTYAAAPGSTAAVDGAGNRLVDPVTVLDGVAPRTPTLTAVDANGRQLGAFYTNHNRPAFTLGAVSAGHTASVYRDDNVNGVVDSGEVALCSATNTSGLAQIICQTDAAQPEGDYQVLVQTVDPNGNVSVARAVERVVIDLSPAVITGFETDSGGILVSFDEPVTGRDDANDWFVSGPSGVRVQPISVTSEANGTQRRLHFSSDPGEAAIWGSATSVSYAFQGASGRYTDLAGNATPDGTFSKAV
jgi:hypothetical protein